VARAFNENEFLGLKSAMTQASQGLKPFQPEHSMAEPAYGISLV